MKQWVRLMIALCVTACAWGAFKRPSEQDCLLALGDIREEPAGLRRLLTPDADFFPILPPGPTDWLSMHHERGQTVAEFRQSDAIRPDATRRIIYLLPLGELPEETSPSLRRLRDYAAAFFQMEVKVLSPYFPHDLEFSPRKNSRSGQRQVLTTDIMEFLKTQLPADAFCLLGLTMADLYPSPTWNFVFGQASIGNRVGVYSFARYDPGFEGEVRTARQQDLILQRSTKVLVHEAAHLFGLRHCIYYNCVVNGSNGMSETDTCPQHLCPVCLRKLQFATGLDAIARYQDLSVFYREQKWFEEFDWIQRQLRKTR